MKTILAVFSLLLLAGCCKEMCIGDEVTISFERFRATETDTVWFARYAPDNPAQALDSFRILSQVASTDTGRSSVTHSISANFHWTVRLPSLNKAYRVENFAFTTEKCNCGGKKYKSVRSYTVNGRQQESLFIRLEK
ncbi:MAG TPA: hypothetical protein VGE06_04940 [Flavisolibacter sp.]